MTRRERLDELTDRWRRRHDDRRPAAGDRPMASAARQALAARAFPYRSVAPSRYVAEHGEAMTAFTYDDERYADAALDGWILEVGRLLRERGR
jgi:hypothetical protein